MTASAFATPAGTYFTCDCADFIRARPDLQGQVQLILTSPPFPLSRSKSYGNLQGQAYVEWFASLAPLFADLLTEDGSLVIEIGNAWEPGRPVQSLVPLQALMAFVAHEQAQLRLCQEFICHNPARLPSPAQWVTKEHCRVTDSFTRLWWMARTDYPRADNRRVLRPYSPAMRRLLANQGYNAGKRPSGHQLSAKSFLKDHGGSIAHNVMDLPANDRLPQDMLQDFAAQLRQPQAMLEIANTSSNDAYSQACRAQGLRPHPARIQPQLVSFFIEFLSVKGDLVYDPFAGSNTTGYCAELKGRRWLATDTAAEYAEHARLRCTACPA